MTTKNKTTATKAAPSLPAGFAPIGGAGWNGGTLWLPHLDAEAGAEKAEKVENASANCDALLVGVLRRVKAFGRDSYTIGGALVPDHGMLSAKLDMIEDGAEVAALYLGQSKIERGQYRGKMAHAYQVGSRQSELPF